MGEAETVDVEEDDMGDAWCVAPTEACSLVVLAVFSNKKDAERFVALLRADRKKSNTYDDLAVLPARARVLCANSYDVKAGRVALSKERL
jgi:hypothetical protein